MLKFQIQGFYSWAVVNRSGKIVRHSPKMISNYILDQGLNGIAVRSWADSFTACALGTGTSSPTSSQTGLDTEVTRTSTYFTDDVAANQAYVTGNVFTLRRTFRFNVEASPIDYTEIGFGYSGTGPGSLFSRTLLNPVISLSGGERAYVQYELSITMSPSTVQTASSPIPTLPSAGVYQYQLVGLKGISNLGATQNFDAAEGCNEPSTNSKGFLSTSSTALSAFNSAADRSGTTYEKATTLSTYTAGTFRRNKLFTVPQSEGQRADWRSLGLGAGSGSSYTNSGFVHVFDANFDKAVFQLSIAFAMSWGRFTGTQGTLFYFLPDDQLMLRQQNQLLNYFGQNDSS